MSLAKITFKAGEVILRNSLHCGQAFRWVLQEESGVFYSTMRVGNGYDLVTLRQIDDSTVEYGCLNEQNMDSLGFLLHSYLRLDVSLTELLKQWQSNDPDGFMNKTHRGVRVLMQDPWETLCSYICSSNNNISRITKMCHSLAINFGDEIGRFDGIAQYSFPSSDQLIGRASEEKLRELGFGYRAKYIMGTAELMALQKGSVSDTEYMLSWKTKGKMGYEEAKEKLMGFPGVGPKVADCVLLSGFALDEVVPVDVHIARIASRDYQFKSTKKETLDLQNKYRTLPLTRKKVNYELDILRVRFQELWGDYAGWAQCVLFAQEIGKTVGATSTEMLVRKRQLERDSHYFDGSISVKSEISVDEDEVLAAIKFDDCVEYSPTGRPLRRAVKKAKYAI